MLPKILALYLPQYYPFKENDEWWGKGFTEWTNVGKAKPLWKGHYQPKVPSDLGYYDLRIPSVREEQARLAKESGVTGFLYWHYWFGNGRRLMDRVFNEVLESGKPDFPFALAWANHSWGKKDWQGGRRHDIMLLEQDYPGIEDARQHFEFLLKAFKDKRYIKVGNKPFFFIFEPDSLPPEYIHLLKKWSKESGFDGLYLVANQLNNCSTEHYLSLGYDAVVMNNMLDILQNEISKLPILSQWIFRLRRRITQMVTGMPRGAMDYSKYAGKAITPDTSKNTVIPQIFPNWDHSPRSGAAASAIFYNENPKDFYNMACDAINKVKSKPQEEQIIILKSWNEWGEGNYMEPDLKFGHGFLNALKKAIEDTCTNS